MNINRRSMLRSLIALAVAVPFVPRLIALSGRERGTHVVVKDADGSIESRGVGYGPSGAGNKTVTLEVDGVVVDTDSFTVI